MFCIRRSHELLDLALVCQHCVEDTNSDHMCRLLHVTLLRSGRHMDLALTNAPCSTRHGQNAGV